MLKAARLLLLHQMSLTLSWRVQAGVLLVPSAIPRTGLSCDSSCPILSLLRPAASGQILCTNLNSMGEQGRCCCKPPWRSMFDHACFDTERCATISLEPLARTRRDMIRACFSPRAPFRGPFGGSIRRVASFPRRSSTACAGASRVAVGQPISLAVRRSRADVSGSARQIRLGRGKWGCCGFLLGSTVLALCCFRNAHGFRVAARLGSSMFSMKRLYLCTNRSPMMPNGSLRHVTGSK